MKNYTKICLKCQRVFEKPDCCSFRNWEKQISCSRSCSASLRQSRLWKNKQYRENMIVALSGRVIPIEVRKKMSLANKGVKKYPFTQDHKRNISRAKLESPNRYWLGKKRPEISGANSKVWVNGNYKKSESRIDSAYQYWRKDVWLRDGFWCKINNSDCSGRLEAHHILSWRDYPELRYDINNGISLCHVHHPRKHSEEKRLSSYFQELLLTKD